MLLFLAIAYRKQNVVKIQGAIYMKHVPEENSLGHNLGSYVVSAISAGFTDVLTNGKSRFGRKLQRRC